MSIKSSVGLLFLITLVLSCKEPKVKTPRKAIYEPKKISFVSGWDIDSSQLGTIFLPKGEKWLLEHDNYYLDTLELNLSKQHITAKDFRKKENQIIEKIKQSYLNDSLVYKKITFDSIESKEDDFGVKTIVLTGKSAHYRIKDLIFLSKNGAEAVFSIVKKKNVVYQDSLLLEIENGYRLNVK